MSERFGTEQEAFWAGDFGDEYVRRNRGEGLVASNTALLGRMLARAGRIDSAIEFGCNIGLKLLALRRLLPDVELSAIEINANAAAQARELGVTVHHASILAFDPPETYDLALIAGVLIHIAPEELPGVYDRLHRASRRYIALAEYYNPSPVEVEYRGHAERLFKRDFAGELLARHPDLRLVDYGFVYHGDPVFPQDDVTWFLLERTG